MTEKDSDLSPMSFRMPKSQRLEVGAIVEGTVEMISSGNVFLNVGAKSEASMDAKEFTDADGVVSVKVGDKISAYVVSVEPELVLSHAMARSHLNLQGLEDARDLGIPVEGKVTQLNKGGLEVDLNGSRAFCPISQIELGYCEDASRYVGQTLQFRVSELSEDGRNIVVSRRALLEEARQEAAAVTEERLQEGAEFEGEVVTLQPYGAFVDIGGIQGLVHVSEISHGRVEHPNEVLRVGQKIKVRVLSIKPDAKNPARKRIGLSIKALQGSPWEEAIARLGEGQTVEGTVVRLQPFGAFVELSPGVDGLIHISELSDRRVNHPGDVVEVGQRVSATVVKLDRAARRIGLSLRGQQAEAGGDLAVGSVVDVVVDKIKPFGLFVKIKGFGRNARGLVPTEEATDDRNANLRRAFPEGSEHKAVIVAVEPDSGKKRLSFKAVAEQGETAEYQKYMHGAPAAVAAPGAGQLGKEGASLGTLADKFKNLMKK